MKKPPITGNLPQFRATDAEIQAMIKSRHLDESEMPLIEQRMTAMTIILITGVAEAQRDADYEHEQNTIREIFEEIEETGVLRDHRYVVEGTMRQEETHYPERCSLCAYQSLKSKFLKEAA